MVILGQGPYAITYPQEMAKRMAEAVKFKSPWHHLEEVNFSMLVASFYAARSAYFFYLYNIIVFMFEDIILYYLDAVSVLDTCVKNKTCTQSLLRGSTISDK